jgi:2-polyprenyl-3-methyl-5-hydroxy-6-metoxy-1,4-benzoquinol methylase
MTTAREAHWNAVYTDKADTEVSWFEQTPETSLALIRSTGAGPAAAIIDIGGGSSRLVDSLLGEGYRDVTVLDMSERALANAKSRLGERAGLVEWVVADVTEWKPVRPYDVWHDRAAFHFLTDPADRRAYVATLTTALRQGGHAIVATFALDGPERCSGLPVVRYSPESLANELGPSFNLVTEIGQEHLTPGGKVQRFQFSRFVRR